MTATCVAAFAPGEIALDAIPAEFDAAIIDPISRRAPVGLPCQVRDADLWFAETPVELELAKSLCETCPAQRACLLGALERSEPCGVWGGEIFERGSIIARKRPRGRPRKSDRELAA